VTIQSPGSYVTLYDSRDQFGKSQS
jgi:hypothetical protein